MTESKTVASPGQATIYQIASAVYIVVFLHILYQACLEAYRIRLYAIEEYGRVIHEFDPYFNYRAAEVSLSRF
jgi:asparagine N-glycosylation enzyme membrane subunit Stt3